MHDLLNVSWKVVIFVGFLGLALIGFSIKGFQSKLIDKKDFFGVFWTERFGIISLNGILLFLGAVGVAILKLSNP